MVKRLSQKAFVRELSREMPKEAVFAITIWNYLGIQVR
jgi:hypothetical protein